MQGAGDAGAQRRLTARVVGAVDGLHRDAQLAQQRHLALAMGEGVVVAVDVVEAGFDELGPDPVPRDPVDDAGA